MQLKFYLDGNDFYCGLKMIIICKLKKWLLMRNCLQLFLLLDKIYLKGIFHIKGILLLDTSPSLYPCRVPVMSEPSGLGYYALFFFAIKAITVDNGSQRNTYAFIPVFSVSLYRAGVTLSGIV
jgi:hypothetical protein